ncbi:MAG: AAA family ATPase, partial [Solirubrobacterales bacterium]|nr:AAA family ATPase [Solirubrobacterales bacterium]
MRRDLALDERPLLEREAEVATLSALIEAARSGDGRLVAVEGDAGIGKTTLVNRTVAEAIDSGMVVLAGAGDSTDQTTAYFAWRRV